MAFTDHCSLYGSVHETGLNRIFEHLMEQRPSLFNYGTSIFLENPSLFCRRIRVHPEVVLRENPIASLEDPLPIVGTEGRFGMHYCLQLTEARIDFHPTTAFTLPPELGRTLGEQQFAIQIEICAGLLCPEKEIQELAGEVMARLEPSIVQIPGSEATTSTHGASTRDPKRNLAENRYSETTRTSVKGRGEPKAPPLGLPGRKVNCFCLEVYAVCHLEYVGDPGAEKLAIKLDGLEIVDIRPEGMENAIECLLATTLRVGLLPKIRPALNTIVMEIPAFGSLSIGPTPVSGDVPHNPAVEENEIRVFVDVEVS